MKNKSQIISILFLLGGVGIIIASFFLFLEEYQESNLFYLNMVATCIVYSINFISAFDIFSPIERVSKSSSGYGLQWYAVWAYTPIALALIILSIIYSFSFNFCLIGHLVLLFFLLLLFFFASIVKTNTNEVLDNIERRKDGLKEISSEIDILEIHNKLNGDSSYQEAIVNLRDAVRYITASDKPAAIALERKLIEKIRLVNSQIQNNSQPTEVICNELKECLSIIELRKKQF